MHRVWAIIERDLRRFRRSPTLVIVSMIMPVVQLVVMGHAFGGKIKNLEVGVVDQDHGVPAVRIRELCNAVAANAKTYRWSFGHFTLSTVSVMEVVSGFQSTQAAARLNAFLATLPHIEILSFDEPAAELAGLELVELLGDETFHGDSPSAGMRFLRRCWRTGCRS